MYLIRNLIHIHAICKCICNGFNALELFNQHTGSLVSFLRFLFIVVDEPLHQALELLAQRDFFVTPKVCIFCFKKHSVACFKYIYSVLFSLQD